MQSFTGVTDLGDRVEHATTRGTHVVFVCDDDQRRVPWSEVHDDARAQAAALEALDVGPGQRVALVGQTSRQLVTAIQATWLAGGAVVIPPVNLGGARESGLPRLRSILATADPAVVLADSDWAGILGDDGLPPVIPLPDLAARAGNGDAFDRRPRPPGSPAVLGFTSGSVTQPKGVVVGDEQLAANQASVLARLHPQPGEGACSWLPLYHDMGMVGTTATSMAGGFNLVLGKPEQFARSPAQWLRWLSDHRSAFSAAPNFGYALAAMLLPSMPDLDLSAWALALNGAEPVDVAGFEAFIRAARNNGLPDGAAFPAYGMAEATVAITLPERGEGLLVDRVDQRALEAGRQAVPASDGAAFAFLGHALDDMEVRIADPDTGAPLDERSVGEVQVRGTSMMQGYFRDPERTAAAYTADGWFRTGDHGYLVGPRLVVCGRLKELIIIGGRNVLPTDVEQVVLDVPGVNPAGAVAFGAAADGTEGLVVLAEVAEDPGQVDTTALASLHNAVVRAINDQMEIVAREVVLVPRGMVPRTTSGKLQRSHSRRLWERGELDALHS